MAIHVEPEAPKRCPNEEHPTLKTFTDYDKMETCVDCSECGQRVLTVSGVSGAVVLRDRMPLGTPE